MNKLRTMNSHHRRRVLSLIGGGVATALAGCNQPSTSSQENTQPTADPTSSTTQSTTTSSTSTTTERPGTPQEWTPAQQYSIPGSNALALQMCSTVLYAVSDTGVAAIDISANELAWSHQLEYKTLSNPVAPLQGTNPWRPLVSTERVYTVHAPQDKTRSTVYALQSNTGEKAWIHHNPLLQAPVGVVETPSGESAVLVLGHAPAERDRADEEDSPMPGQLFALSENTGEELWRLEFANPTAGYVGSDGQVYIADGSTLRAITPAGTELWSATADATVFPPLELGDTLVMLIDRGGPDPPKDTLVGLSRMGQEQWRYDYRGVSPIVAGDVAFIAGPSPVALGAAGEVQWDLSSGAVGAFSPDDMPRLFVRLGRMVTELDPASGERVWSFDAETRQSRVVGVAGPIRVIETETGSDPTLHAVDDRGRPRLQYTPQKMVFDTLVREQRVYLALGGGFVTELDISESAI